MRLLLNHRLLVTVALLGLLVGCSRLTPPATIASSQTPVATIISSPTITSSLTPSAVAPTRQPASPTKTPARTSTPSPLETGYELVGRNCSIENCLFRIERAPNWPLGVATLKGYYKQIQQDAGFGAGPQTCDAFVVVGGSQELIGAFLGMIAEGNSVSSKNEANQPIINLDLSILSGAEQRQIRSSLPTKLIQLVVLRPSQLAVSAPACFSFVEILKVK
jgi:hypothetical protein